MINSNGEVEIWCSALKKPETNANNDDPAQKSTKRRKLNSSQSKTTAAEIPSDPIEKSVEDSGTRRITRSAARAQTAPLKVKLEGRNQYNYHNILINIIILLPERI